MKRLPGNSYIHNLLHVETWINMSIPLSKVSFRKIAVLSKSDTDNQVQEHNAK